MTNEEYTEKLLKIQKEMERGLMTKEEFVDRVLFLTAEYLGIR